MFIKYILLVFKDTAWGGVGECVCVCVYAVLEGVSELDCNVRCMYTIPRITYW